MNQYLKNADALRARADAIRRTARERNKILARGGFVLLHDDRVGRIMKEGEPEGYVRGPNVKVWVNRADWWEWMHRCELSPLSEEEWAILKAANGLSDIIVLADRRHV